MQATQLYIASNQIDIEVENRCKKRDAATQWEPSKVQVPSSIAMTFAHRTLRQVNLHHDSHAKGTMWFLPRPYPSLMSINTFRTSLP